MKAGMDTLGPGGQQETELTADRSWNRSNPMFKSMKNFAHDESGVTAIEYALIAALMSVVLVGAWPTLSKAINTAFSNIAATLNAAS
jgi:pilus assembly protein Flp/PilA